MVAIVDVGDDDGIGRLWVYDDGLCLQKVLKRDNSLHEKKRKKKYCSGYSKENKTKGSLVHSV